MDRRSPGAGALALSPRSGPAAYFTQNNSWYGRSTANLGRNSDRWAEGYVAPGLIGELDLGDVGRLECGVKPGRCVHPWHRRCGHQC